MNASFQFGLIGHNIGYSRSPAVFAAIFAVDGVEGRFDLFDIAPDDFDRQFDHLLRSAVQGLSVTIPYKQRVIDRLDQLDPAASALNAVNSIAVGDLVRGFNTDVYGFSLPLRDFASGLRGGRALILGCGGGARAAAFALGHDFAVKEIVLVGRSLDSLSHCRHELEAALPEVRIEVTLSAGFASRAAQEFSITVNGTPLGGWNHSDRSPLPEPLALSHTGIYYDLNYNDGNKLVAAAKAAGVTALDGSGMLVAQAVRSYSLWTGRDVPFEPVYQRVFSR